MIPVLGREVVEGQQRIAVICCANTEVRMFADECAWRAHLAQLGIDQLKVTPDPVLIATEGALWGAIHYHRRRRSPGGRDGGAVPRAC